MADKKIETPTTAAAAPHTVQVEDPEMTETPVHEECGAILVRLVLQFRDALQSVQEMFAEIDPATQIGGHPGHPRGDGTMLAGEIAKALLANDGRLPGNDGNALRHVVETMTKAQLQDDPEMLHRTANVVRYICECLYTGHKSPHVGAAEIERYGKIFSEHMNFSTARVALEAHNAAEGEARRLDDLEKMQANFTRMQARSRATIPQAPKPPAPMTPQQMANRRFSEDRRPGFGGRQAPNTPEGEYRPDPAGPPGSFIIADGVPHADLPIGPPPGLGGR
jgi:hypothetical protein